MRDAEIIAETESCLPPILDGTPYSVYDVEFVKEGPNRYLRVFIDKDGGVGVDDCEFVSRRLEKVLDERDFIKQAYILEVSSPGINRRLKKESDFIRYAGRVVDVKLYKTAERTATDPGGAARNLKNPAVTEEYRGELKCLNNGYVTIGLPDGSELKFPSETATVRLSVL